jgi:hypothetical protein
MTIIATTTNKNYYRGRWTVPTTQVGRFVGRRKQRYGADLWCYVQIDSGRVEKMLDLPLDVRTGGGCDEAWRLQAAIDSLAGSAQRFRRRAGGTEEVVLDFFNPLPRWVIRRWLFLARPAERRGSLLSYAFPRDEVNQEIGYLAEQLWMEEEATYAERSGDKA